MSAAVWALLGSWAVSLGTLLVAWYYRRRVAEERALGAANARELTQRRAQVKILRASLKRAQDAALKEFSDAAARRLEEAGRVTDPVEAVHRVGDGWADLVGHPAGVDRLPPRKGG